MMFSDVAYHPRNPGDHPGQLQSRPRRLENRSCVSYLDFLPTFPAVINPYELRYNASPVWRSSLASADPSARYASPPQRTNSFCPRTSVGSPQGGGLQASEHMLRRKTPRGTLAAGYDGTPGGWASNPHAGKGMQLPLSNKSDMQMAHPQFAPDVNQENDPTTAANHSRPEHVKRYRHNSHGRWEVGPEAVERAMRIDCLRKSDHHSPGMDSFLDQVPGPQGPPFILPNGQHFPTVMQPTWQPYLGPTASDEPGPYGPYWPNGSFVPYRPAALRDPRFFSHAGRAWVPANEDRWTSYRDRGLQSAVGPRLFTPAKHYDPVSYPHQLTLDRTNGSAMLPSTEYPLRPGCSPHAPHEPRATHDLNDTTRGYEAYLGRAAQHRPPPTLTHRDSNNKHGRYIDDSTRPTPFIYYHEEQTSAPELAPNLSDAHFKERVLSRAHRVYIDLLASLHQSRRASHHGKHVDGRTNLPRANIYPRPPRQPPLDFSVHLSLSNRSPRTQGSCRALREDHIRKKPRQDGGNYHGSADTIGGPHGDSSCLSGADSCRHHPNPQRYEECLPSATSFQPSSRGAFCGIRRPSGPSPSIHTLPSEQGSSPSSNAVVALDMLTQLCEESGWLWIDGMLLGGCLAYGLGDYHGASRLYSKILANDPK